ncbi:hypothetical protein [Micromonospora rubida]
MNNSRASVNLGNVAEFNRQFFPADFRPDHLGTWELEGHHYACLAPFYSSDPGIVVMPLTPRPEWVELQLAVMRWPHLDLRTGVRDDADGICAAVLADDRLLADVAEAVRAGSVLLPWGHTAGVAELRARVAGADGDGPAPGPGAAGPGAGEVDCARFESKVRANERFRLAAAAAERVVVARQDVCASIEEAAVTLARRIADTGRPQMLKSDFGVGGFGTTMIAPEQAATPATARRLLAALIKEDAIYGVLPLIVEEYVPHPPGLWSQTNVNAEIEPDGTLRLRGCAAMDVVDTKYAGAVVGGGLDHGVRRRMEAFGTAVGQLMREAGYVGWFDIDFIRTDDDVLVPTETNARRTGPTAALSIAQNLAADADGTGVVVRTNDRVLLPRPATEQAMLDRFLACARSLGPAAGVRFVPTIVTATDQEFPYFGFAAVGDEMETVNAATEAFSQALLREDY